LNAVTKMQNGLVATSVLLSKHGDDLHLHKNLMTKSHMIK